MPEYRNKVTVSALQWTGTNMDEMNTFMESETQNVDIRWSFTFDTDHTEFLIRNTGVGDLKVAETEWVVCFEEGVIAVHDDDTFNATYEPVT